MILLKYLACILILAAIVLLPAWVARQTGKEKLDMVIIRISSWLFGWTGVGWLYALYLAARK